MTGSSFDALPWAHVLVVGASSGIGEAIARRVSAGGASVALVARRQDRLAAICADLNGQSGPARAHAIVHDVRNTSQVEALFQQIAATLGGLDLVVYAAGVMPAVGPEEFSTVKDLVTVESNVSGAVAWLNQAATRFSRAREGTIVGISSVAGDRGRRTNPAYNATKAFLNSYLESLRNRLAQRGVTVLTARLGYVRTPLIQDMQLPGFLPVITAEQAADEILRAAARHRRVAYIPSWWRVIMIAIKLIPSPVFERLRI